MKNLKRIEELKERIEELKKEMEGWEFDEEKYETLYDESLDEAGEIKIGSLSYSPSLVLKKVDPTAYRCGFSDFLDSFNKEDDADYQELERELEELECELETLEEE